MAHFFLFVPQVRKRVRIWRGLAAELGDDLDAILDQCAGFARIVREQTNPLDAETAHDRGRQIEIPDTKRGKTPVVCRTKSCETQFDDLECRDQ
jgi:hypothetical protein